MYFHESRFICANIYERIYMSMYVHVVIWMSINVYMCQDIVYSRMIVYIYLCQI